MKSEHSLTTNSRDRVKALVLDWGGTVADAYVIAPAIVFVEVFKRQGVVISMDEARGPMGLRKDLHIEVLAQDPQIRERWKQVKGVYPSKSDVDAMYADFVPLQLDCLRQYARLLPGVAETATRFQAEGIKIGSTTGFVREMIDILLDEAHKQGFHPDATVGGDEVINGVRPAPFMLYRNLDLMNVHPIHSVVKVDDTEGGIHEGLEAGCWTVGIARYSNYMNINSLAEAANLSKEQIELKLNKSRAILEQSGAHYVINEFVELTDVVERINSRLAAGEKP